MTKNEDKLMKELPSSPVDEWDCETFKKIWTFEEFPEHYLEKLSNMKKNEKKKMFLDQVNGTNFFNFPIDNYKPGIKRKIDKC